MAPSPEAIRQSILGLAQQRGPDKSLCPSEVARALGGAEWRSLMPEVRAIGIQLATTGHILVTQKGHPVDPQTARGPIRYRLPPSPP